MVPLPFIADRTSTTLSSLLQKCVKIHGRFYTYIGDCEHSNYACLVEEAQGQLWIPVVIFIQQTEDAQNFNVQLEKRVF